MVTPKDIDFHAPVIRIPTLKRRKTHLWIIPVKPRLLGEVGPYLAATKPVYDKSLFKINRIRVFQIAK